MPMEPTVPNYLTPTPDQMRVEVVKHFDHRDLESTQVDSVEVRTVTLPCGEVRVVCDSANHILVRPGSYLIENRWLGTVLKRRGPVNLVCDGIHNAILARENVRDDYHFKKIPFVMAGRQVCELLVMDSYRVATDHSLISVMDERAARFVHGVHSTLDDKAKEALSLVLRGSEVFDCNDDFNPRRLGLVLFKAMRRLDDVLKRVEGIDLQIEVQIHSLSSRQDDILHHYADIKRIVDSPQWSERSLGASRDRNATLAVAEDLEKNAAIVDLIYDRPFSHSAKYIAKDMRAAAVYLREGQILHARSCLKRVSQVTEGILATFVQIMGLHREFTPLVRFNLPTSTSDRDVLTKGVRDVRAPLMLKNYDEGLEGAKFATQAIWHLSCAERAVERNDLPTALDHVRQAPAAY